MFEELKSIFTKELVLAIPGLYKIRMEVIYWTNATRGVLLMEYEDRK